MIALERELAQDWQGLFYPRGPELPEGEQIAQAPVTGPGGAAFGITPAMKSAASRTGQISPAGRMLPADVAAGALKGTITGGVGLAGDIESLLLRGMYRMITRSGGESMLDAFISGLEEKTILPTSEDVDKWLDKNIGPVVPPGAPMAKERAGVAEAGQLAGELTSGPGVLIKGAKAGARAAGATAKFVAPKAGEMLSSYMRRSGMTPELMAYHGTPHTFAPEPGAPMGRFRAEKIGSGEGAQAYGHGLYFAESPGVAGNYRSTLSYRDMVREFRKDLPDDADFEEALDIADKIDPKRGAVIKALADNDWLGFDYPSQAITAAFKNIDNFDASPELLDAINKAKGSLYTVDIPDEMVGKMLDWDKPLIEQSQEIQQLAKQYGLTDPGDLGGDLLSVVGGKRAAGAKILRDAGIPGVRYFDQSTRRGSNKEITRNIVVFPGGEDQIKIIKVE
jgi:hypothetical protein